MWKKGYNPEVIFADENSANMCQKSFMDFIPNTEPRTICVTVNPVLVSQLTPFSIRFNMKKVGWNGYSPKLDKLIEVLDLIPGNYNNLVEYVSRIYISRGCRTEYTPGLTEEATNLYEADKIQYVSSLFSSSTMESVTKLLNKMTDENRRRCTTHGNAPKGTGSYLRPKTHILHQVHNISVHAHTPLQIMKPLTATGWGKQKETLMATYKAVMRPDLMYASSIWSPLTSSTIINNLQLMQNAALRTAT